MTPTSTIEQRRGVRGDLAARRAGRGVVQVGNAALERLFRQVDDLSLRSTRPGPRSWPKP